MTSKVKPVPEGYHTITPSLVVRGGARAVEFYKKAFGAKEIFRMDDPGGGGKVMHAQLQIGDSFLMLGDEDTNRGCIAPGTLGGSPVTLFLYVKDVDASFKQAIDAGCSSEMPVQDMFWGDRFGSLKDPFGHKWGLATHKEDVSREEMEKRAQQMFATSSR